MKSPSDYKSGAIQAKLRSRSVRFALSSLRRETPTGEPVACCRETLLQHWSHRLQDFSLPTQANVFSARRRALFV